MTESEWLECTDTRVMLPILPVKASGRKRRLFGCGCVRSVWDALDGEWAFVRKAVEMAEGLAEGVACEADVESFVRVTTERLPYQSRCGPDHTDFAALLLDQDASHVPGNAAYFTLARISGWGMGEQCNLLRDIFGNPFRPVTINPEWQTPTVSSLAAAASDNRILPIGTLEPARLAVLADALEEAGCNSGDILSHLRSPGPHVRGCWGVDLLLGKV